MAGLFHRERTGEGQVVEASMLEPDPIRRMQQLAEAEGILLEDQPVVPLFFYVSRRVVKPWVKGWDNSLLDYHPTRHMYIDASSDGV